jgi:hypothetical protein
MLFFKYITPVFLLRFIWILFAHIRNKLYKNRKQSDERTSKYEEIQELFHYGFDHLATAIALFDTPILKSPNDKKIIMTLDSAAYLANIGIEQILKACLLWEKNNIKKMHGLFKIAKKINFLNKSISPENWQLIKEIDLFGLSRYPRQNGDYGIEIDQDDKNTAIQVFYLILEKMPEELFNIYENIGTDEEFIKKGNRILLKKKIE